MESKWYDTSESGARFPDDDLLRLVGFAIAARPNRGPVLWLREGKTYTVRQALHLAKREVTAKAKAGVA